VRLLLIRHALPVSVDDNDTGAPADPTLSALGRDQARHLARWLAGEAIDVLYTSPLRRAVETAEAVASASGLTMFVEDDLAEFDHGASAYVPFEEFKEARPEVYAAMRAGRVDAYGLAEPDAFRARAVAAVERIVTAHAGQTVAAIVHGGIINAFIGSILGVERLLWFEPDYTSVSRVAASRSGVRSVVSLNETAHLQPSPDRHHVAPATLTTRSSVPDEPLRLTRSGPVAQIELCRPDVLNRFDGRLHEALGRALGELDGDRDVRAVVLCAEGRVFSAGGDTDYILAAARDFDVRMRQVDDGRRLFRACADFAKPLVVALHADVYGLGATIVLTADAIVSTPGVKISDPHVTFGLVAGDGGCVSWPLNMPLVAAKRRLLWGETLLAQEAHRLGIVTDLVDSAEAVRGRAWDLAERVASLPPVAVQLTKRTFNAVLNARISDTLDLGFYLEAISVGSEDLPEALTAFKERRPGRWVGR